MKHFLYMLFFTITVTASAQDTIEKSLGEFSTVKVFDLINLKMIKSDENKAVISGDNKNDVELINKNGLLKIRMNIEESYDGNDTVVILYYTSIDIIDANEGAKVEVQDTISQYEIYLKAQEGAEIDADIKTTYANFRAVTGGIINVSGTSKNQDVSVNTGGEFDGRELVTSRAEASVKAGGEVYIHATEYVEAKIKVGGNIYIYGNPKEIDESKVLGGTIKRM